MLGCCDVGAGMLRDGVVLGCREDGADMLPGRCWDRVGVCPPDLLSLEFTTMRRTDIYCFLCPAHDAVLVNLFNAFRRFFVFLPVVAIIVSFRLILFSLPELN